MLAAKTTAEGVAMGMHPSRRRGTGMEFSQYRSYQPGDDLRSLDWKMFARSDRYYVRESETETSIAISLLLDASASMNHEDEGISKMQFAKYVVASLAYLGVKQGDAVGLYIFQQGQLFSLPSQKQPQHLTRLIHELEQVKAGGRFTEPVHYRNLFLGKRRRELLVFVTDFYQQHQEISQMLDLMSSLKHEIIVLQVMAGNELELKFDGYSELEDLETHRTISINTGEARLAYQKRLTAHLSQIRNELLDKNIFYTLMKMTEPIDSTVRDFLLRRDRGLR